MRTTLAAMVVLLLMICPGVASALEPPPPPHDPPPAETTAPVELTAGNPNSLMSTEVETAYEYGFNSVANTQQPEGKEGSSTNPNQVAVGGAYGVYRSGNVDTSRIRIPLSYTFISDTDINNRLTIRVPIDYIRIDHAEAFNIGVGIGVTFPILDYWLITPGVDYAYVNSANLDSEGHVITGSLTSALLLDIGNTRLSMGNMFAYGSTLNFSHNGYSYDPRTRNYVFRNGLIWMLPADAVMKDTSLELFVVDTRYVGSDLYVDNYQEFGFSYGFVSGTSNETDSILMSIVNKIRFGVTYLYSSEYKGVKGNMGFTF